MIQVSIKEKPWRHRQGFFYFLLIIYFSVKKGKAKFALLNEV